MTQVSPNGGYNYTVADLVDMDGDGLPDRVSYDSTTSPNQYQVQKNLGLRGNGGVVRQHPLCLWPHLHRQWVGVG